MLHAQLFKGFLKLPYAPSLQIRVSLLDTFDGFRIVLSVPFECLGKYIIKRSGRILPMPLSIVFQLRLAFWFEGYGLHEPDFSLTCTASHCRD